MPFYSNGVDIVQREKKRSFQFKTGQKKLHTNRRMKHATQSRLKSAFENVIELQTRELFSLSLSIGIH